MRNRRDANNPAGDSDNRAILTRYRGQTLFAQFAQVMVGDFVQDKTQGDIQHPTERARQERSKKIAEHIGQCYGQRQGRKCAHAGVLRRCRESDRLWNAAGLEKP